MNPVEAIPDPLELAGAHEPMQAQPTQQRPPDRRNHLTLVEFRHTLQLSKIPKPIWESMTYLYVEWLESRWLYTASDPHWVKFLEKQQPHLLSGELDPDEENLTGNRDYITGLLLMGQNVEGWKGDLVTSALKGDREVEQRSPAGKLAADESGKMEPRGRRFGLFG